MLGRISAARCPAPRATASHLVDDIVVLILWASRFYDRFTISQVCQRWRRVALKYRALWKSIRFPNTNPPEQLLQLALKRSSPLAVDLELLDYTRVGSLIRNNFHRLRSLVSPKPLDLSIPDISPGTGHAYSIAINYPAPFLQHFSMHFCLPIPEDFLGKGGSLRRLDTVELVLPGSCPALRTLTHLNVDCGGFNERELDLENLFKLCPVLESLTVSGFVNVLLPAAPAPPTLSSVYIGAMYDSPCICRTVSTWRGPALDSLTLTLFYGGIPEDLGAILQHAVEMRVRVPVEPLEEPARDEDDDFFEYLDELLGDASGSPVPDPGETVSLIVFDADEFCTQIVLVDCDVPDKLAVILSACSTQLRSLRVPATLAEATSLLVSAPVVVVV